MKSSPDRPPILRFLLIFIFGLALVTGLAALAHTPDATADDATSAVGPGLPLVHLGSIPSPTPR